jgi:hypothetical protein
MKRLNPGKAARMDNSFMAFYNYRIFENFAVLQCCITSIT